MWLPLLFMRAGFVSVALHIEMLFLFEIRHVCWTYFHWPQQ